MKLTVGKKIKKYRIEKGMTQEELGKELGVGKAAVQKYESDQVQNLKASHIRKLCVLFDRRPWDFIFDDEPIEKDIAQSFEDLTLLRQRFGNETIRLLEPLAFFNNEGQRKVREYIYDLAKIKEYRRND